MRSAENRSIILIGTILLAAVLWYVTFYLTWSTFWIKISLSAATLAIISILLQTNSKDQLKFNSRSVILGLVSAAILYLIFWTANKVTTILLPFADTQIGEIYGKGSGTPTWVIALLLFFITGPAEEIYWRGFLQKNLMLRFGAWQGWLLAVAIYAGVHIWSFNFMLIAAAGVAGAFWGFMYWQFGSLAPVIISHSIWSAVIFAVFPVR